MSGPDSSNYKKNSKFGMYPKDGSSSPPQETVSKTSTLSHEHPFVRMHILLQTPYNVQIIRL